MVDERNDFNLSVIASTADICLAVTSSMVSRLSVHNRRSYFVEHGHVPGSDVHVALPAGKNKIRALYAGNLRMQFLDWELIGKVVRSFPDMDFYFVGSTGGGNMNPGDWPVHPEMLRLHEYPNVILTGEVDYATLNSFMQQSDILMLMYDAKRFPDEVANSHKILSYLSSGKVVVATYTREYDGMGLLEMATDQESYMSILKEVADNKDAYNNPALMSKRMSYANEHTYMKQLTRIEELISKVKS
jgi:glycosyltransferase involved in cell wall biosynthesis